jgi:glyoxylase-like metal-dependent hydrolase (beta-lactamase superfamily II)
MDVVRRLVEERPDMFALAQASPGKLFQVNEFIWCSPGVSNVYLIKTTAGDIQLNAGMGVEAPTHKAELAPVRSGPLPYLILTQGHVDHVGGVSQLRAPETKVIAQRNNAACQEDDRRISGRRTRQSARWFPRQTQALQDQRERPSAVVQDVPTPEITFDDRYDIELGGLKVELLSVPGGETIDSLAVHLPQHRIVFTGNMFGPLFPHFPNLYTIRGDRYRFVDPYLWSLRRVRALEPELLVTGHFDPIVGKDLIGACLDRLEAAVDYVHRTALDGLNAGKDVFALMREVVLPDELYVGQGYGKVSWCVRTFLEQYMGWFHGEATSDLYPTRPGEIVGDLVEMAGVDAVAARGRQKLEAGDPETALLFAETALAADPKHASALRLSLDAHRAILDRSDGKNFWELGWLRAQIATLEHALA